MQNRKPTTENRPMKSTRPCAVPAGWWIGLAVGALLVPGAAVLDRDLMVALRPHDHSWLVGVMQWVTWLGYGLADIAIPVAIGLRAWWRGDTAGGRRGLMGGLAVALAGIVDQLLKNLLCRARPNAAGAGAFLAMFPCFPAPYALASFPSGHTTTAFALATILSLWYPWGRWVWGGGAVLVGWSRIILGSHFPSDVLAGAVLGVAVVLGCVRWWPGFAGTQGQCKTDNRQPRTDQ
jgi:undecaprenyl-diphosphatase